MKLTSDKIKQLSIGTFKAAGGAFLKDAMRDHIGSDSEYHAKLARQYFNKPESCSDDELHEHIYKLFTSPSEWIRGRKCRLKDDVNQYFTVTGEFAPDFMHYSSTSLAQEIYNDKGRAERCWLRTFHPKNDLAGEYQLAVVTTPEDDQIVGWVVITM